MTKNNLHQKATDRGQRIELAIKRIGVTALKTVHGVTAWSVYKWAKQGYVPNERLELFCHATGELPHQVCDPCIAHLMQLDPVISLGRNTTKSRKPRKAVAGAVG